MFEETTMRRWCQEVAAALQVQRIARQNRPYLDRYFLAGWNPVTKGWTPNNRGPAQASLYLHHFRASDPEDSVHSHPWDWAISLILVGGYREERCQRVGTQIVKVEHEYRPGSINLIAADDKHRIDLLGVECWSLFLVGPYRQSWGFDESC